MAFLEMISLFLSIFLMEITYNFYTLHYNPFRLSEPNQTKRQQSLDSYLSFLRGLHRHPHRSIFSSFLRLRLLSLLCDPSRNVLFYNRLQKKLNVKLLSAHSSIYTHSVECNTFIMVLFSFFAFFALQFTVNIITVLLMICIISKVNK